MTPVWNRGCDNPLRQRQPWNTKTALFTWMSPPLPRPGGMFPGTPLKLSKAFMPLQVRTMLPPLHFSGFLWSCYTSEVSPDSFSNGGGVQQWVLLGSLIMWQVTASFGHAEMYIVLDIKFSFALLDYVFSVLFLVLISMTAWIIVSAFLLFSNFPTMNLKKLLIIHSTYLFPKSFKSNVTTSLNDTSGRGRLLGPAQGLEKHYT